MISAPRLPPHPPRRRAQCAGAPRLCSAVSGTRGPRRLDSGCCAVRPTRTVRLSRVARTRHRRHGLLRYPPVSLGSEALGGRLWAPGGGGVAAFWRGRVQGSPRGSRGPRIPGRGGAEGPGLAEEGGDVRRPARPLSLPGPGAARGCALAPSSPTWRRRRLECNWTCRWRWLGETAGGWIAFLQVGLCAPVGVLTPGTAE